MFNNIFYRSNESKLTDAEDQDIVCKYCCGDCGILAVALHHITGLPIIAVRYKGNTGNKCHWGVKINRQKFIDIRGILNRNELLYGMSLNVKRLTICDETETYITSIYNNYSNHLHKNSLALALKNFDKMHPGLLDKFAI